MLFVLGLAFGWPCVCVFFAGSFTLKINLYLRNRVQRFERVMQTSAHHRLSNDNSWNMQLSQKSMTRKRNKSTTVGNVVYYVCYECTRQHLLILLLLYFGCYAWNVNDFTTNAFFDWIELSKTKESLFVKMEITWFHFSLWYFFPSVFFSRANNLNGFETCKMKSNALRTRDLFIVR